MQKLSSVREYIPQLKNPFWQFPLIRRMMHDSFVKKNEKKNFQEFEEEISRKNIVHNAFKLYINMKNRT